MVKKIKFNNENQFNLFDDKEFEKLENRLLNFEKFITDNGINQNNKEELDLTLEEFKYVYSRPRGISDNQEITNGKDNISNIEKPENSPSRMENSGQMEHKHTETTTGTGEQGDKQSNTNTSRTTGQGNEYIDESSSSTFNEEWDGHRDGNLIDEWNSTKPNERPTLITPFTDFKIPSDFDLSSGGAKLKFANNLNALKTLNLIESENRLATDTEKNTLVKYVGFGGLPQVFDLNNTSWEKESTELLTVLTESEYSAAKRSTQDSHYTPKDVINSIYNGLLKMGFTGGNVLEPAAGIGHFIGLMPDNIKNHSKITTIELDSVSFKILKTLYPSGQHLNEPYQNVNIPSEFFDVVIGNPPFGNQRVFDREHGELADFSIHNYFLAKSIDKLKEGGLLAMCVTHHFLDNINPSVREHISKSAKFLGAIRLPHNAFKKNALTEVTTDIVFFQKTGSDNIANNNWLEVGSVFDIDSGDKININQYFIDNPNQMIGEMKIIMSPFKKAALINNNPMLDIAANINERLTLLPSNIFYNSDNIKQEQRLPIIEDLDEVKVGSYFITPAGDIAEKLPNILGELNYRLIDLKNEKQSERLKSMISIRDQARRLIDLEKNIYSITDEIDSARESLNHLYDSFVKKYNFLNTQINVTLFRGDVESALLFSLENDYSKGVSKDVALKNNIEYVPPSAKKADIFHKRVIFPSRKITHANTSTEALTISINEYGRVNIPFIMNLTGKNKNEIINDLHGEIYLNPINKEWETSTQYLSGNVKEKLILAKEAAEQDLVFNTNIDSLEKIIPADIEAMDIAVQLGAPWVDGKYIDQFSAYLLDSVYGNATYIEATGKWDCNIRAINYTKNNVAYGIEGYGADEIIGSILANRIIQVKSTDKDGIQTIDHEKTTAVLQKAEEIKNEFIDWIWKDEERRNILTKTYNDKFNNTVAPDYTNKKIELKNASLEITLNPHQLSGIYRGIESGNLLIDHCVGAGKTFELIAIAIESKRMGLINKPLLVVPNHLLGQWRNEIKVLYPSANILIANEDDFEKNNRQRLFASIATNNWDAVVIGHSSFKKIPMPADKLQEIIEEQVNDVVFSIEKLKSSSMNNSSRIIKQLEKTRDRITAKLEKQSESGKKDNLLTFEQLGIDLLVVDELQEFKNLNINTSLNIAGLGNTNGSDKAFDLFVKVRYLQEKNNGRGFIAGTGTPISNSISEVYTLQRYFQYDVLKKSGLHYFDAWASTFGKIQNDFELDATGSNYKLNSRFSSFQNVPELISLYKTFADTILNTDLEKQAQEKGMKFPIPKLKNGKPTNILVDRSPEQEFYINDIIFRMEHMPKDPRIDNHLKITSDARKAGLDFRLIDSNAEDYHGSKVNEVVNRVFQIYKENDYRKGTQLIFCDLSTPKKNKTQKKHLENIIDEPPSTDDLESTDETLSLDEILANNNIKNDFSVYSDIKTKLIERGMKEEQIAFIHDADSMIKKNKLFKSIDQGEVRVCLGSTFKMGAGTNVQSKLVALHHVDCPWRPSDLEQREGRIIRQGNEHYLNDPDNFEIEILRYATKQTYDSRQWQTIEIKAASIELFRKGNILTRTLDDVGGEAANAAEMKAAASGNPLILTQVNLKMELNKLEALYKNYKRNILHLESNLKKYTSIIERKQERENIILSNLELRNKFPNFSFLSNNGVNFSKEKKEDISQLNLIIQNSIKAAVSIKKGITQNVDPFVCIGTYRGFKIKVNNLDSAIELKPSIQFFIEETNGQLNTSNNLKYYPDDKLSLSGLLTRIDNYLASYDIKLEEEKRYINYTENEIIDIKEALKNGFPDEEKLKALRIDNLNVISEIKQMNEDNSYQSKWEPSYLSLKDNKDTPLLRRNVCRP